MNTQVTRGNGSGNQKFCSHSMLWSLLSPHSYPSILFRHHRWLWECHILPQYRRWEIAAPGMLPPRGDDFWDSCRSSWLLTQHLRKRWFWFKHTNRTSYSTFFSIRIKTYAVFFCRDIWKQPTIEYAKIESTKPVYARFSGRKKCLSLGCPSVLGPYSGHYLSFCKSELLQERDEGMHFCTNGKQHLCG